MKKRPKLKEIFPNKDLNLTNTQVASSEVKLFSSRVGAEFFSTDTSTSTVLCC